MGHGHPPDHREARFALLKMYGHQAREVTNPGPNFLHRRVDCCIPREKTVHRGYGGSSRGAVYLHRGAVYLHRGAVYLHRGYDGLSRLAVYLHRWAVYLHRGAVYLQRGAVDPHRWAVDLPRGASRLQRAAPATDRRILRYD